MFVRATSRLRALSVAFTLGASPTTAISHEFWIDPVQSTPKVGATVPVVFRIGQDFKGNTYPFVRALSERFVVRDGRGERPVKTLDGDDPAADITFASPGLAIIAHQRKPEDVVFETFAKFEENLVYEGLEAFVSVHRRLGKPMSGIRELYARCAKALVSVGGVTSGSDRAVGLPLELVAEKNPYGLNAGDVLPVRLVYNGKPIAGALVKTFNRDAAGSPRLARTDADGRVTVTLSHRGEYLVSAVHMIEPPSGTKADWVSFWASLTFTRP